MKCICDHDIIELTFVLSPGTENNEVIGYLLCCTNLKKCGLNSNWQKSGYDAEKEMERKLRHGGGKYDRRSRLQRL